MKSQEEIRKRQQEYKDKMFNKFSNYKCQLKNVQF